VDAKAREAAALKASLEDARRALAVEKAAVATKDARIADLERSTHGHTATATEADGLRARVDALTRELVEKAKDVDEAKRALEAEKAAHARHEAEWKAGGGGGSGADHADDHAGFLQVAQLLDEQGVKDPRGVPAFAATLARFFEDRMADAMARAERGEPVPETPAKDISTRLIGALTELGVTSTHGLDHLFQTVDHLVDAALTHWGPAGGAAAAEQHGGGGDHHADAHAAGDHHPPPHAPDHHAEPHADAGHAAHDAGHGHHRPDASGFVI
jgi:hypothetical protein